MSQTETSSIMVEQSVSFSEWRKSQDFDYSREASEVIDYINKFVNYERLDEAEGDWEETFANVSEIDTDSKEFEVARAHITAYINT